MDVWALYGFMGEWMDGWMNDKCECNQVRIRAGVSVNVRESLSVNTSSESLVGQ